MRNDAIRDRGAVGAVGLNGAIPNLDYTAVVSTKHLYVREKNSNVVEFYDLQLDPGAQHNLGASHPKAAAYAKLEDSKVGGTNKQIELDDETRQQLKTLGYLQ